MSGRAEIFGKIKAAIAPMKDRAVYPEYDRRIAEPAWLAGEADMAVLFARRLTLAGGVGLAGVAALGEWLQAQEAKCLYVDPSLRELVAPLDGVVKMVFEYTRDAVDEIDTALTVASGGIAETGTIILTDQDTPDRLAALAPWRHVAVLRKEQIFRSIGDAIAAMPSDPGVIWVTGPSKTADVEGILIQGVHGPGVQGCLVV
ncbi:lactate utilization protein [soil metagenome]